MYTHVHTCVTRDTPTAPVHHGHYLSHTRQREGQPLQSHACSIWWAVQSPGKALPESALDAKAQGHVS